MSNQDRPLTVEDALMATALHEQPPRTVREALQRIVVGAREAVPGFDHVGVTTQTEGKTPRTCAATSALVRQLDNEQHHHGEGPCVDALDGAGAVLAADLGNDRRWPRYVPEALDKGVRSQVAISFRLNGPATTGALNLYATAEEDIDPDVLPMAELFAALAADAINDNGDPGVGGKTLWRGETVFLATGILMERYAIDEDRALSLLIRPSTLGHVSLDSTARALINHHVL